MSLLRILPLALVAALGVPGTRPGAEASSPAATHRVARGYLIYYRWGPDTPWAVYNARRITCPREASRVAAALADKHGVETFIRHAW